MSAKSTPKTVHDLSDFLIRAITLLFYGFGIGLGAQQPLIAVQALLKGNDIALGTSLVMFLQVMSGTVMVSVGQNLFEQRLSSTLATSAPGVNLQVVLSAGNEGLAEKMIAIYTPTQVQEILGAYNKSLDCVFLFALVLSCLSAVGSLGVEWRNIRRINEVQDRKHGGHASELDEQDST